MSKPSNKALINILRLFAVVVPLSLYLVFTLLFPPLISGFIVLGIAGCFVIAFGLELIIDLLDRTFIGKTITTIVFVIGCCVLAISVFCSYSPYVHSVLSEDMVIFYFLIWSFLLYIGIIYLLYRFNIKKMHKNKKITNSTIKKCLKGYRNFWFYEGLHQQYNLGILYPINKALVYSGIVTCILHCILGWLFSISPIISILMCGTCVFTSILGVYIIKLHDDSKFQLVVLGVVLPLLLSYVTCTYTLQLWMK